MNIHFIHIVTITSALVLSVGCNAHAENVDSQFDTLVRLGKDHLSEGRLELAARQFRAAAALKPAPNILLRVVSLYTDIARQSNDTRCKAVKLTLQQFFDSCDRCTASTDKSCKVCSLVSGDVKTPLIERTYMLAKAVDRRSVELAKQARTLSDIAQKKTLRRSRGLLSSSKDIRRCIATVTVDSTPAAAAVRIDGKDIGLTPITTRLFEGRYRVTAHLDGRPPIDREYLARGGQTRVLDLAFTPRKSTGTPHKETSAEDNGPEADRAIHPLLLPITTTSIGLIAAGVGGFLISDAVETSDDASTPRTDGRVPVTRSAYQDAKGQHTMGIVFLAVGGAVTLAGTWWTLTHLFTPTQGHQHVQHSRAIFVHATPSSIGVGGTF